MEQKQEVASSSLHIIVIWTEPQDIVSWLLKTYTEKDTSTDPTEPALDEDSRVLIVAGSETTATTLASALYYLVKNPPILSKLQRHLDEDMPEETLRLRPVLMMGGYRVTPAENIQVGEMYIPGDVNVFVPVQLIQTDERYYNDTKQFVAERWNEKREDQFRRGIEVLHSLIG